MTGYLHSVYAESFKDVGKPTELPQYGGWIIIRQILGSPYSDAMGCYPLFLCRNWSKLHEDLENPEPHSISIAVVTGPFGDFDEPHLERSFKNVVVPFKEHFVADLHPPVDAFVSKRCILCVILAHNRFLCIVWTTLA